MNWESRLNNQMIVLTVLLIVGLFIMNAFFILSPPDTELEQKLSESKRNPAAIQGQKIILESPGNKMVTRIQEFKLDCFVQEEITVDKSTRQIQLNLAHCNLGNPEGPSDQALEKPKVQLVNIANNFTASIFSINRKRFKTDLIQLKAGNNEIVVRSSNSLGEQTLSRLFVKRK